ncbi:MAG TPA: GNAT family N-acetyltransferase [Candidatus Fimimorpha excrementavium]|nr:GNAT family N-acetyltransferase [Candidatus Fimimorpha excrementavium]
MIHIIKDTKQAAPLFEGWQETMIWSCLQNVMGTIYGKDEEPLRSAKAVLGDFCFFAGEADRELIRHEMEQKDGADLLVPQNAEWEKAMEEEARLAETTDQTQTWHRRIRYALKKEPDVFSKEKLEQAVKGLKPPYQIKALDEQAFLYTKTNGWCRDWTSQFLDYAQFKKLGLGYVIYDGEQLAAGASSYTRYRDGIEIQIDTKEEYRNKGLAYACAAKLILECQSRGWYASWDAHNRISLALAEKLGYHFDCEYPVFERRKIK